MKDIDTTVLVRYLVEDDKEQVKKASARIDTTIAEGESCYISIIVLCELVWVLDSTYGFQEKDIAGVLEKILMTKQFEIELKDIARLSLDDYRDGQGDFADYVFGRNNRAKGCKLTYTFDRSLKNQSGFIIL